MAELRLQSLPGVLLPGDVLSILSAVGEVKGPQIAETLRRRSMQLRPDLLGDYPRETSVSRASRDSTAISSLADRDGKLSSIFDKLVS
jgi:hypothetical protein